MKGKSLIRVNRIFLVLLPVLVMAQYDYSELVDMADYSKNYRTLDCWECFQAKGKMCHPRNYQSIMLLTGSSNFGHSICCKPDYTGNNCNSNEVLTCGPPSIEANPDNSKYSQVLNDDNRNYQMFAFCPALKPERCGMNSTDNGMTIYATQDERVVVAPDLRYREGPPAVRRHDACFYLIHTDINTIQEDENTSNSRRLQSLGKAAPPPNDMDMGQDPTTYKPDQIQSTKFEDKGLDINLSMERMLTVKITKAKGMNVFIYEGMNRFDATKDIVEGNRPNIGRTYAVNQKSGILVVAYPNKDETTEFEFIAQVKPKYLITQEYMIEVPGEYLGDEVKKIIIIIAVVVVVFFILVGGAFVIWYRRDKNKVMPNEAEMVTPSRKALQIPSGTVSLDEEDKPEKEGQQTRRDEDRVT